MGADYLTRVFIGVAVSYNDFITQKDNICFWKEAILPHVPSEFLDLKEISFPFFFKSRAISISGCKFYNVDTGELFFGIEVSNIQEIGCQELDFETIYEKKEMIKDILKKLKIDKEVKLITNLDYSF